MNIPEGKGQGTLNLEISREFYFHELLKTYIYQKISQLGYDLPISVVDRVILPFHEDFIFTELRMCEVSQK